MNFILATLLYMLCALLHHVWAEEGESRTLEVSFQIPGRGDNYNVHEYVELLANQKEVRDIKWIDCPARFSKKLLTILNDQNNILVDEKIYGIRPDFFLRLSSGVLYVISLSSGSVVIKSPNGHVSSHGINHKVIDELKVIVYDLYFSTTTQP